METVRTIRVTHKLSGEVGTAIVPCSYDKQGLVSVAWHDRPTWNKCAVHPQAHIAFRVPAGRRVMVELMFYFWCCDDCGETFRTGFVWAYDEQSALDKVKSMVSNAYTHHVVKALKR